MSAPAVLGSRRWASPRVHALATLRGQDGSGCSLPPFQQLNLGSRCGDSAAAVATNREQLMTLAGLPCAPHWLRQVHGTVVVRLGADGEHTGTGPGGDEPEADAAVTTASSCVLAVLTADCLPVVLAAADGSSLGIAHAGWRGLCAGVLEATVAAMAAAPMPLQAWLGPAAGPHAYEVGDEVRACFVRHDPAAAAAFVATRTGHWLCDLYALARLRLAAVGVEDVAGGDHCTISEPAMFFSHRRDGVSGRMATLAWLGD